MAPVAGMLKERGFRVTGSDVNVYPPASTLLDSLGHSMEGRLLAKKISSPRPISASSATPTRAAIPKWNTSSTRKFLTARCRSFWRDYFHSGTHFHRRRGHPRQDDHHRDAGLDLSRGRTAARFLDRRRRLRILATAATGLAAGKSSLSKATNTTRPFSTRARSSCTIIPTS